MRSPVPTGKPAENRCAPRPPAFPGRVRFLDVSPGLQADGERTGMEHRIHGQQPEGAFLRRRKVAGKRDSEVSVGEREIADGLEEPTIVPIAKGRLKAQLHHRPHSAGTGERINQLHNAIGPIVKMQQIKDLLLELGEGAGIHTLHNWLFFFRIAASAFSQLQQLAQNLVLPTCLGNPTWQMARNKLLQSPLLVQLDLSKQK